MYKSVVEIVSLDGINLGRFTMRRKPLILLAAIIVFFVGFLGCSKKEKDFNEVTNILKDLKSYSTDFTMEIKNDKQIVTYNGKHFYDKALGHRMELGQERVFIYKEDMIYVKDKTNDVEYTLDKSFDEGFRLSFPEEYVQLLYSNEEIKYELKEMEGKKYQLIHLIVPGNNKDIDKAVMYVDLETNLPEYVFIYDSKNNEKMKVTYKNFLTNMETNKDLFKTE